MKNSIFQVIIIAILLLGMTASVLVINENTGNANQNVYYPEINDSSADSTEILDLNGYKRISFENKTFPIISYSILTEVQFDNNSTQTVELDKIYVTLGQKISPETELGEKNGAVKKLNVKGVVVDVAEKSITVKDNSKLSAYFSHNIYSSITYKIGDQFDVFKNGAKQAEATVVDIDYMNVFEDCVTIVTEISDKNSFFISDTSVELFPKGYEERESLALSSSELGINNSYYQTINKYYKMIFVKGSTVINVDVFIGISYGGFSEIVSVTNNGISVDVSGGYLYVKDSN